MMFSKSQVKTYALKKDKFISISIEMTPTKAKAKKDEVLTPNIEPSTTQKTKEVDIEDLFSDVWTKGITKKKKPKKRDNKRVQEILRKTKISKTKEIASVKEKIKDINTKKLADKNTKASTADEVNEYRAKIKSLVYDNFNPPENTQGYIVVTVIELSSLGKVLDFRILKYSSNQALNEESDKIKSRLTSVLFPKNPDNKSFIQKINLVPD